MAQKHRKGSGVGAGLGMAALAAAAAGAYFLYGSKEGAKRRQKIKSWTLRMKGDVMDKMENMREWSEEAYNRVVDGVSEKYKNVKNVDRKELDAVVKDLKKHWNNIRRQVEGGQRKKPAARRKKV
ncbi:hypothetical protein KW782_00935 [Candidatus Parcubacteria bacterium]|nr:hypothetical protein [Candidatus Parcubacteria bacterium]